MLRLLSLNLAERRRAGAGAPIGDIRDFGGYPRIHAQNLDPAETLGDYFASYVKSDARRIGSIHNPDAFRRFARLYARRIGQPVNPSLLAAGTGVSPPRRATGWTSCGSATSSSHCARSPHSRPPRREPSLLIGCWCGVRHRVTGTMCRNYSHGVPSRDLTATLAGRDGWCGSA